MEAELRFGLPAWAIRDFAASTRPIHTMAVSLVPVYALWTNRRGASCFPPRDALTPRDLKEHLGHIAILRVIDGGSDFEYRIVGDVLAQAFGEPLQGKLMSELVGPMAGFQHTSRDLSIRRVVGSGTPSLIEFRFVLPDGSDHRREVLHLPLGDDGKIVDHILTVSDATIPLTRT